MAELLILDDDAVADAGRVALDLTPFVAEDGPSWGDAEIEAARVQATYGEMVADFRIPNRTITVGLVLRDAGGYTFDEIRTALQAKVALFQQRGGWVTRECGSGIVHADVVGATLKLGGSTMAALGLADKDAVLTLECRPDWYGDERELDALTETTDPALVAVLQEASSDAVIAGDYPGRVRIVVTEADGETRRGVLWGLRSRYYDDAATAALVYAAEDLTPLDAAEVATSGIISGAAGGAVIRHSALGSSWTPVLSTEIAGVGQMTHRGSYRVWARVYSPSDARVRLVWAVGDLDHPGENASVVVPGHNGLYVIDLGEIRLDKSPTGTHYWQGMIQAYADGGGSIQVDELYLQPVDDGCGQIVASLTSELGTDVIARDAFDQTAGALSGKAAPVGGNWSGSGDSDDFSVETSGRTAQRTATSDSSLSAGRRAVLTSVDVDDVLVSVDVKIADSTTNWTAWQGVIARYVDASNYLLAVWRPDLVEIEVYKVIAGSLSSLLGLTGVDGVTPVSVPDAWITLRIAVLANGDWMVFAGRQQQVRLIAAGNDSALATGGALESGAVGFYDARQLAGAATRQYDNFWATTPNFDAAIHASQTLEIRTDGCYRENADGSASTVIVPRGSLPRLPVSGLEERPVELFLLASRGDFDRLPDRGIDDLSARVFYRPCWLFVPDGSGS